MTEKESSARTDTLLDRLLTAISQFPIWLLELIDLESQPVRAKPRGVFASVLNPQSSSQDVS